MGRKEKKFTYSIVIPTILAITMFIVSFYAIIIPLFEKSMMDRKKEMIHELTNTAWSVLVEYNQNYKDSTFSLDEAQRLAALEVGRMRYGNEQKDYFWIITNEPVMINHPYRPELIGQNLSDFSDNHENKMFVDAVNLVDQQEQGIIEYYWQWKDDASREVPKLSYVKEYPEWNWIIGTGIYLEDVKAEIKELRSQLFRISILIIVIVVVILFYVLKQTKIIEEKRKEAVSNLTLSKQKYKSLVDASTEGTLMAIDQKIIFANNKFLSLLKDKNGQIVGSDISLLFELKWDEIVSGIKNPNKTHAFETKLTKAKAGFQNIVVYITQVEYSGQTAYIFVVKNVTDKKRLRLDKQKLSDDIQLSLQLMNQPVANLVKENISCNLTESIKDAVIKMNNMQSDIICIKSNNDIIGVVTDHDIRNRAITGRIENNAISSIMTSPVIIINKNALLYEAVLKFRKNKISHLLIENNNKTIIGNISYLQCLEMQHNSLSFLIREIEKSNSINELKAIYNRMPILIQAIFTSTDNISSVSRIISSIADAINIRVIEMTISKIGTPPCDFAFIAMGSEGRGEQTLKTDQDNAIIFSEQSNSNKEYFLQLGEIVNENLHTVGYARCEGDLMAGNPEWCNHIGEWEDIFSEWITNPEMSNVLDSSIFFDLRLIYGSKELIQKLWNTIYSTIENNNIFIDQLSKTVTRSKPTIDKKHVDTKVLLLPIISYLRLHALNNFIEETNSMLRLNHLMAHEIISESKAEEVEKMYNFLMHLRIKWQVNLILDNDVPTNSISLFNLTTIEQDTLKNIVREISKIQDETNTKFKKRE